MADPILFTPPWQGKNDLLWNIPGVGPVLFSTILAKLHELGKWIFRRASFVTLMSHPSASV